MISGLLSARSARVWVVSALGAAVLSACLGNGSSSSTPTVATSAAPAAAAGSSPAAGSPNAHGATGAANAVAGAATFQNCPQFFIHGTPPAVAPQPHLRALCYDAFAILHNGSTRTPVYVAQRLNRALVADADEKRTNKFFADARLPRAERAELSDYKGSGYSRGHMAPAGDMPTAQAMAQSFSLANMVPQSMKQNSGPWARIEKDTRSYAARASGDVYIITGPVYDAQPATVGANRVAVPSHLFKLVYDASTGRAWAHWQANRDDERNTKPISYAQLVERTGVDFLPGVAVK